MRKLVESSSISSVVDSPTTPFHSSLASQIKAEVEQKRGAD